MIGGQASEFRYALSRRLSADREPDHRVVTWILLNPSTANAYDNDPTLRRVMGFTNLWGFKHLVVVNLFGFRAAKPEELLRTKDPHGPENTAHILEAIALAQDSDGFVVCAWGTGGGLLRRDLEMIDMLRVLNVTMYCLKELKHQFPAHPLYIPYGEKLVRPMQYHGRKDLF